MSDILCVTSNWFYFICFRGRYSISEIKFSLAFELAFVTQLLVGCRFFRSLSGYIISDQCPASCISDVNGLVDQAGVLVFCSINPISLGLMLCYCCVLLPAFFTKCLFLGGK